MFPFMKLEVIYSSFYPAVFSRLSLHSIPLNSPSYSHLPLLLSHRTLFFQRHYVKLQEELAKLPVPPGLEDLDEPLQLPAGRTMAHGWGGATPPPPTPPSPPVPLSPPTAEDIDHDMEKIVSEVLDWLLADAYWAHPYGYRTTTLNNRFESIRDVSKVFIEGVLRLKFINIWMFY